MNNSLTEYLVNTGRLIIKSIITFRQSYYLIKICSLYTHNETGEFFVKFQLTNKRICSDLSLRDFINSPLIHLVHPKQLYYLGVDTNQLAIDNIKQNGVTTTALPKKNSCRFKRLFITNEN